MEWNATESRQAPTRIQTAGETLDCSAVHFFLFFVDEPEEIGLIGTIREADSVSFSHFQTLSATG